MDLGVSFNPTAGQRDQDPNAPQGPSQTPIQDAIKTLSLRIPSFRSQGGLAPMPLLQSPGGMALPGGTHMPPLGGGGGSAPPIPPGLVPLLQQYFGGGAPLPNVIPGLGPGETPGGYTPGSYDPGGYQGPSNFPDYYNNPQNGGGMWGGQTPPVVTDFQQTRFR